MTTLKQRIFGDKKVDESKLVDSKGYYTGYCQCNCDKCRDGKVHCQGLVCQGD